MYINAPNWYILFVWKIFFIFSQWLQQFFSFFLNNSLLAFSNLKISIALIPLNSFPLLFWVIKLSLNWCTEMEIVKQWIAKTNLFWQHDHTIEFLIHFDFTSVSLHYIATYDTHSFFLSHLNFHTFSAFITNNSYLGQMRYFF